MSREPYKPKAFLQLVITDDKPACATVEPELFFPNYSDREEGEARVELAKSVCKRCPITNACLEFALATGDNWAILGGMTPEERRVLRQRSSQGAAKTNPFVPLEGAA